MNKIKNLEKLRIKNAEVEIRIWSFYSERLKMNINMWILRFYVKVTETRIALHIDF